MELFIAGRHRLVLSASPSFLPRALNFLSLSSSRPQSDAGNVFATDSILAHLMASPRTVFPWDIVATYLPGGVIFLGEFLSGR